MRSSSSDDRCVAAFDLLVPGLGELAGGSEWETELDRLVTRMKTMGIDPIAYG